MLSAKFRKGNVSQIYLLSTQVAVQLNFSSTRLGKNRSIPISGARHDRCRWSYGPK